MEQRARSCVIVVCCRRGSQSSNGLVNHGDRPGTIAALSANKQSSHQPPWVLAHTTCPTLAYRMTVPATGQGVTECTSKERDISARSAMVSTYARRATRVIWMIFHCIHADRSSGIIVRIVGTLRPTSVLLVMRRNPPLPALPRSDLSSRLGSALQLHDHDRTRHFFLC